MRRVGGAGGGAGTGDLLDGNRYLPSGAAASAVLLVDPQPEQAQFPETVNVVPRELACLVVVGRPWSDFFLRELANGISENQFFFGQQLSNHLCVLSR